MCIYIYIVFSTHPNLIISYISYQHMWCANVSDHLSSKACPSTVSAAVSGAKPSPGTTPPGASTRCWRPARPRRRGWWFNVYWISVNLYIYVYICLYMYIYVYIYAYMLIYYYGKFKFLNVCLFCLVFIFACTYTYTVFKYIYICLHLHCKIV